MALNVWLHSLYERYTTPTNLVIRSNRSPTKSVSILT